MMLTTICRPGKEERATAVPMPMPMNRLIRVAVPETFRDSHVIARTSGSKLIRRDRACLIPASIISIPASPPSALSPRS